MKKTLRIVSLALAMLMFLSTLCGCSSFMQGFMEGYFSALNGENDNEIDLPIDDDIFSFDEDDDEEDDVDDGEYFLPTDAGAINPEKLLESNTGNYTNADLIGKWVDEDGEYLEFYSNGTADWYGEGVIDYNFDGKTMIFDDDEELRIPARLYGDDIFVMYYSKYIYDRWSGADGLTGRWECDEEDYSLEFSANGKFREDDYFDGYYYVRDNDMILCYSDGYVSYCVFAQNGDQLGFAYGYPMYRVE